MRHLKLVSYAITGVGGALVVASLLLDLNPTFLLVGLMLIIAGGVKIGMVALWNGVAGFGAPVDQTAPSTQSSRSSGKQRKRGRS